MRNSSEGGDMARHGWCTGFVHFSLKIVHITEGSTFRAAGRRRAKTGLSDMRAPMRCRGSPLMSSAAPTPAAADVPPGLVYVHDGLPGITRRRSGKGFSYRRPDGTPLADRASLQRIRALAIPPAYTQVWIF